jgi:hypothetical protein
MVANSSQLRWEASVIGQALTSGVGPTVQHRSEPGSGSVPLPLRGLNRLSHLRGPPPAWSLWSLAQHPHPTPPSSTSGRPKQRARPPERGDEPDS